MTGQKGLKLRSEDAQYLELVDRWWAVLLPKIGRFLVERGGNILMVQVQFLLCRCICSDVCQSAVTQHLHWPSQLGPTQISSVHFLQPERQHRVPVPLGECCSYKPLGLLHCH